MSIFKLYHFVNNNREALGKAGFIIDSARAPREAFYGQLPADDAVLAKQMETGPWTFCSQHITIEKYIDPNNPAMGPHWTLIYGHKNDPSKTCVVHAYFNKKMQLNGCYQQRIIQSHPDETQTTLFSENYDAGKMKTDMPYLGVPLSLQQINNLASFGSRLFAALHAEKAKAYLDLQQAIEKNELEITQLLFDKSTGYLTKASTQLRQLECLVNELNDYSDGKKNVTDILIVKQLQWLEAQQSTPVKSSSQDAPVVEIEEEIAPITVRDVSSMTKAIPLSEKEIMQSHITGLLNLVMSMKVASNTNTEAFYQHLQDLNTALALFELMHDTDSDKAFSERQRKQLPASYFNLPAIFKEAVLTGDLPIIQSMFYTVKLNMDLSVLFSELMYVIEEGMDNVLCDRLIPVVYYLHEHSDLFQAFVLFKMNYFEYPDLTNNALFEHQLRINLLSRLYIQDNLRAYCLYLDLGCSPEGMHSRYGNVAFNALQTVLFTQNTSLNRKPYIDALFEHGAVETITRNQLPETYITHAVRVQNMLNPASVCATLFNHMNKNPIDKKRDKRIQKSEPRSTRIKHEVGYLDAIIQNDNILSLSRALYQSEDPEILGVMASHCDMKTCLLEYANIIAQDIFTTAFIPSTIGGAAFYANQRALEKDMKRMQAFSDVDNITLLTFDVDNPSQAMFQETMLFAERKTMRIYVTFNTAHMLQNAGDTAKRDDQLACAKMVYQQFERLFITLTDEEKRAFVKSIIKLAIQSKLAGKPPLETLKLYDAAIIANSLIHQMVIDDYKCMIKLFLAYGKTFDDMKGQKTSVPREICNNLGYLFCNAKLHPMICLALAPDIRDLQMVIHADAGSIAKMGL